MPLPETLLDAVLLRTEALSLAARNALERAAVVGQRCNVEHVPDSAERRRLAEALAAGFLVAAGPGYLEFRHALVRDAIYEAIPWTRRRSLHASVARSLEEAGASAAERATHWLGAGDVARARTALAEAAEASAGRLRVPRRGHALRAGARSRRRRRSRCGSSCSSASRRCAELAGDLAGSARAWREVIDGRRGRGEVEQVAEAQHAIGRVLALRGSSERALTAWSAAADSFAACGRHEDAARSRHRRGRRAAGPRAACAPRSPPSSAAHRASSRRARRRTSARARARSRASLLGKLGETPSALASVHEALTEALSAGHTATAAAAYQALAVVHENAGDFGKASEAYEVAIDYCAEHGDRRRRAPSARPASATCSASAASGAAASRSAGR